MKNILDLILDGITFKDLAGKRQPRTFAVMALVVIVLLAVLFIGSAWERNAMMSAVEATALPVQITMQPSSTPEAAITQPAELTQSGCPTNPDDWSLADVFISESFKLIQPACVYDGLAQTVAWAMAVRQGYTRAEATELLGFGEMPLRPLNQASIPDSASRPVEIQLNFIPPHPGLAEWRITDSGQPAVAYGLRGCFRTHTVTGNTAEPWGGNYEVVCMVVEDATNAHVVYALDGHVFTSQANAIRSFLLFGYAGDGLWVWLGARSDPQTLIDDAEKFANERLTYATLYDTESWTIEWWNNRSGLEMKALPDDWQNMTATEDRDYILSTLNQYLDEARP